MKIPLLTISAMIVFTACNREAKRDSGASNATVRTENDSLTLSEKARNEGREMEKDVSGAADKTGEEARQAGRDIKEGASAAGAKIGEEARQASRDVKGYMKADDAASAGDREILDRIRKAFKSDAETAKEAGDISISVNQGKVSLFGTVTSTDTKAEMIRIAEKEKGVVRVTEEIKIAERVGAGSRD